MWAAKPWERYPESSGCADRRMDRCPARWAAAAAVALALALLLPLLPAAVAVGGCQDGDLQAKDETNCIKFCNANAPVGYVAAPNVYPG